MQSNHLQERRISTYFHAVRTCPNGRPMGVLTYYSNRHKVQSVNAISVALDRVKCLSTKSCRISFVERENMRTPINLSSRLFYAAANKGRGTMMHQSI